MKGHFHLLDIIFFYLEVRIALNFVFMQKISHNGIGLYYIKDLKKENLDGLQGGLSLEDSIVSELRHPTYHPKFEEYSGQSFLVLRFPEFEKNKSSPSRNNFRSDHKFYEALAKWSHTQNKIKSIPELELISERHRYHFDQLVGMVEGLREIARGTSRIYPESGKKCDYCFVKKACKDKIQESKDFVQLD